MADRQTATTPAAQPSPGGQGEALHAAVSSLYFDDSSDYQGALWNVVRALDPVVAGLLERDPHAAYEATKPGNQALAARRPVASNQVVEDIEQLAVDGARQPVGEPVGAAQPGNRVGMLEAACGPDRKFDPAAADAELASIPLVPLWDLPELHPRKVADECLTTMEQVRQGTKPHTSRRHKLTEAIALTKRFIEQQERSERLGTAPPAQAVDPPYSLDADPAGIRARVADVITGTLMVGAQGHTPPPAGHWAEPFWQAARADAVAQAVDLGPVHAALQAAARSLRTIADSTKDTEFLETASEIRAYANSRANCAEQALIDSQAVGNG